MNTAAAHGGKPVCTRLEEPEKLAQAELSMGTALLSAQSLNAAQVPFSASEEIIITSYLLPGLLLFVLTQKPHPPCSVSWH